MQLAVTIQGLTIQSDGSANVTLQLADGAQFSVNVAASDFAQWPLGGSKTVTIA